MVSHGAFEFKERYIEFCENLAMHNIAALVIDMNGHGESEGGRYHIDMKRWISDIRAGIDFLTVQPEIDPFLVVAIIFRESSFRRKVKGKRGEIGLMQVMPRGTLTRSITKDDLTDVRANVRVGVGHLHYWQEECGSDDMVLWLSAYNAGKCKRTFYGKSVRKLYCKIKPGGCGGVS